MAKKEEKSVTTYKQPNAIQRYFNETIGELRKVNWPTRKEAINLTAVVLVVAVSMSLLLGLMDYVFNLFFQFLLSI